MFQLSVIRGPHRGASIALAAGSSCTIGSAPDSDLRVGGDAPAAAVVVKALKGGGFGAKGLAGEFLHNGQAIAATRLSPGDTLTVGDSEIRFVEAADDSLPDRIGGFQILGVLGKGGMGTVYRARQISLDREVALKVLSPERVTDPTFIGRFQAEARHAARLHHPNVVQVFDVDQEGDRHFFSMELMEGGSLEGRLRAEGRLAVDDAIRVVLDAARGLAFAEQMRVVHRDIKPDNLMVDRHGHVKLADLGLAHAGDEDETKVVGTPHFMPPEQIRRQPLDHRSDLYALGCTFFRLVTGKTPFNGGVKDILRGHLKDDPPRADAIAGDVPAGVADVIARLMAKEPEQRHQSASELIAELEYLLTPPVRKGPWVAAAVVAILLGGAGLGYALLRPEKEPTVVTQIVDNEEERAALAEQQRQLDAEKARLDAMNRGLTGEALATALEQVAADHPDTSAAVEARAEAAAVREAVRVAAEARARFDAAVATAVAALEKSFRAAVEADDVPAAEAALRETPADPEIAASQGLAAARARLRSDLDRIARAAIEAQRDLAVQALTARDADAAAAALGALAALLREDGGWPRSLLPTDDDLGAWVTARSVELERLRAELEEARTIAGWQRTVAVLTAADGPLAALLALDFAGAAGTFQSLAAEIGTEHPAHPRLAALIAATGPAEQYLQALRAATSSASPPSALLPATGERVIVTGIAAGGIAVRAAAAADAPVREVAIPELLGNASAFFPALEAAPEPARGAFVGLIGWAAVLRESAAYLRGVDATDDASGTGADAYAGPSDPLRTGLDGVDLREEPWTATFAAELRAALLASRTLHALSTRRNTTAAQLADRLIAEHTGSLTVRTLR